MRNLDRKEKMILIVEAVALILLLFFKWFKVSIFEGSTLLNFGHFMSEASSLSDGASGFVALIVYGGLIASVATMGKTVLVILKDEARNDKSLLTGLYVPAAFSALVMVTVFLINGYISSKSGGWIGSALELTAAPFLTFALTFGGSIAYKKMSTESIDSTVSATKNAFTNIADMFSNKDIICPSCGAKSEKGSTFCINCGAKLPEEVEHVCKNCGEKLKDNAKFCPNCGVEVEYEQQEVVEGENTDFDPDGLVYDLAISKMEEESISSYEGAIKILQHIPEYKDSKEQIEFCKKKIEELKEELRIEKEETTKNVCEEDALAEEDEYVCPSCGASYEKGRKFCMQCGTKLPENTILICKYCGEKLPENAKFCHNCGKTVERERQAIEDDGEHPKQVEDDIETSKDIVCPSCGTKYEKEIAFCMMCGAKLTVNIAHTCENCGEELSDNARFCPNCGMPTTIEQPRVAEKQEKLTPTGRIYNFAMLKMAENTIPAYEEAIKVLRNIPEYRDSKEQVEACKENIAKLKVKLRAEKLRQKKIRRKRRIEASIAIMCILLEVLLINYVVPKIHWNAEAKILRVAEVGDVVTFGKYEQDDNRAAREDIEWLVLDREDDRILVITDKVLAGKYFDADCLNPKWEHCSLREWLNDYFFANAFDIEEQKKILETEVIAHDNPYDYYSYPGNDTEDKVFLLSTKEANEYFPTYESRKALATIYAAGDENTYPAWWLRTTGYDNMSVTYVDSYGDIDYAGDDLDNYFGVRPVIWINLE